MITSDNIKTVGIVGLGLIGGSFAKAFKENSSMKVLGCDLNSSITQYAIADGTLSGLLTADNLCECDLIIPALYPDAIVKWLNDYAKYIKRDAWVIDTGGLKRIVCDTGFKLAEKYGFTFVGGHPMAGKKFSGYKYSTSSLFHASSLIIVPEEDKMNDRNFLTCLEKIFAPCHFARLTVCSAEKHDSMIAFTSEMAHIVSSAYIKSPTATMHKGYSAGSYRDMTRVAWLNEDMWTDIFLENSDNLIKELNYIINNLCDYRTALENKDAKTLHDLLHDGKVAKEIVDGV